MITVLIRGRNHADINGSCGNLCSRIFWNPDTIHQEGFQLTGDVKIVSAPRNREGRGESEKITLNLGHVDLGRIDLLVKEGFYSNRSDFIRTAIRNQLVTHSQVLEQGIERHTLEIGLRDFQRSDLEAVQAAGEMLHVKVLGLARIAEDVSPELALATIGSMTILGSLQASREVRDALGSRIQ